jgi:hypothetical protein
VRSAGPRCSEVSRRLDESLIGTASVVRSWILLEQPGPWGYDAPAQSRIPGRVAREIRHRARSLQVRVVLIRRHGRSSPERRICFFSHTGISTQRLERLELTQAGDLLDVDWAPLRAGEPVAGRPHPEPLFLVCTNGARDRCCAEKGRAVAAAMSAGPGDRAWECSHIGGDRFAGNLVCFPHGVYYGRVAPAHAPDVAGRYERGLLDLEHYRGRSCYDFPTQAAEALIRTERDLPAIADVRLVSRTLRDGRLDAEFDVPGERVRVSVAVRSAAEPRRLTCQSTVESQPPQYELLELVAAG